MKSYVLAGLKMISTNHTVSMEKSRILIMDDAEEVLAIEADILTKAGYSVGLARCGEEAVELYKKAGESGKPFDAVMLALTVVRGMGAIETLKELIKLNPGVKAIISSGHLNDAVIDSFTKYGIQGILFKPSSSSQLIRVVSNVMKKSV